MLSQGYLLLMATVMKRAIFAVVFCLAAASTGCCADDTLAGLIQAGNRDAALKSIAAGADVNAAQGDGYNAAALAVYKVDVDLAPCAARARASPMCSALRIEPFGGGGKVANARLVEMLLDAGSN